MIETKESIAVDTSTLLEYIEGTDLGKKFKLQFLENENITFFYITPLVQMELLYICCRKMGFDQAYTIITTFLKGFIIYEESKLRESAARLKCQYAISIADCYSLALAKIENIPLFMKREIEIENILKKEKLPAEIIFIDDIE